MSTAANSNRELPQRLIRLKTVLYRTGLSRSGVYRLVVSGDFPQPIKLTKRSTAWVEAEINAWVTSRIAERKPKASRT